jgi:hypothetical protein
MKNSIETRQLSPDSNSNGEIKKDIFKYKNAESGKVGLSDIEISDNYGGIEFKLEAKDCGEGDSWMIDLLPGIIKGAIDAAGQEMFQARSDSDEEDAKHYMSAMNISSLIKFFLNPKFISDVSLKLETKNSFGYESMDDLTYPE